MYNKEKDQCQYKGITFSSINKRAWAVFMDCTDNEWFYKPELPECLKNNEIGMKFYTDFFVRNVMLNHGFGQSEVDLWIDTTARRYSAEKIQKLNKFSGYGQYNKNLQKIPSVLFSYVNTSYVNFKPEHWFNDIAEINFGNDRLFSFLFADGDEYAAVPCITYDGQFQLSGPERCYMENVDEDATIRAYELMCTSVKMNFGVSSLNDIELYAEEFMKHIYEKEGVLKQIESFENEYHASIL